MLNPEIERLEASTGAIVRRAYELGWTDALRKVVDELNARHPGLEQIDLGPATEAEPAAEEAQQVEEAATPAEPPPPEPAPEPVFKPISRPAKPWWARFGRQ